jgi:hypothetical protein
VTFAEVLNNWMGWILFAFAAVGVAWAVAWTETFGHRCGGNDGGDQ